MTKAEDEALREYARKRIKNQQDFKGFIAVWVFVSALLIGIWFWASPETFFWPIFGIGGMGIGAYFQWMEAYGPGLKKVITEADIDAELERLKRKG